MANISLPNDAAGATAGQDNEVLFVVNQNGGLHNVPGSWVTIDNVGVVRVRGNGGYRMATDDEITEWYEAQGLDRPSDAESKGEGNDPVVVQPDNFTVAEPGTDVVNPPTGDALAGKRDTPAKK